MPDGCIYLIRLLYVLCNPPEYCCDEYIQLLPVRTYKNHIKKLAQQNFL